MKIKGLIGRTLAFLLLFAGVAGQTNAQVVGGVKPVIQSLVSSPNPAVVSVGGTVEITVLANGAPAPTYQWRKAGVALPAANASAKTNKLVLSPVALTDSGDYTVFVQNSIGAVTSAVMKVTVVANPSITTQPKGLTVVIGPAAKATFTVAAVAPPVGLGLSVGYQWKKGGGGY